MINSLINSVSQPFRNTALRRRHTQTVRVSTSSYKIDYVIVIKNFLNPEGHQNPISGSQVTAILLKGWILPIGGASLGRVCAYSRLFYNDYLVFRNCHAFYVTSSQQIGMIGRGGEGLSPILDHIVFVIYSIIYRLVLVYRGHQGPRRGLMRRERRSAAKEP